MKENQSPIIAVGLNNIGCDQTGASFQTIVPGDTMSAQKESDESEVRVAFQEEPVQEELCHFIHPAVTDEKERLQIHKEIKNLVRNMTIQNICAYLQKMTADSKILQPIEPSVALEELRRMGMPGEEKEGFTYKNFVKYYRK